MAKHRMHWYSLVRNYPIQLRSMRPSRRRFFMPKRTSRREFFHLAGGAATGFMAAAHPAAGAAQPQAQPASRTSMGARFRALLQGPEPVLCIGAHDVLAARLVEINGFPSIFIGGSTGASNGHALPDIGLVSTTELIEYAARIMANI